MKRLLATMLVFALLASPVFADDTWVNQSIGTMESVLVGHDEGEYEEGVYKGWAYITVTNSSQDNWWGDFHFEIYEPLSYNVIFPDTETMEMLNAAGEDYLDGIAPSEYTYAHDGPQKLDFFFYDNPVGPGQTVTFNIYTDNTAQQNAWFGLILYPTPVPEPATLALLCLGALGMAYRKRS